MLSSDIKKEVAALWDIVSSAGLAPSPYVALEQIACLIFLKRLHEIDAERIATGMKPIVQMRLPNEAVSIQGSASLWDGLFLQDDIGSHLAEIVFPWLRTLEQRLKQDKFLLKVLNLNGLMNDAYFQLDTSSIDALHRLVRSIDALFPHPGQDNNDIHSSGEVFEHLFAQASKNSKIGQVTTAPHIARFMVSLLNPAPGESIIDPAVGTGTLLVSALQHMRESETPGDNALAGSADSLVGIDLDHTQTRIGWVNLLLQGVKTPVCVQGNSLAGEMPKGVTGALLKKQYDLVLADLPFGGRIDLQNTLSPSEHALRDKNNISTDRVELLFIWRVLALLKPGGRAALIIPQSVLSGTDESHVSVRRELLSQHQVEAVILLPGKMYAPFIGISAALLVVRKPSTPQFVPILPSDEPKTRSVWFYEVSDDGMSVDPRKVGPANTDSDLRDALVHFKHRKIDQGLWESNKDRYFQDDRSHDPHTKSLNAVGAASRSATQVKQWQIPVRNWLEYSDSRSVDGSLLGSHDESGSVRPEYIKRMESRLYVLGKLDNTLLEHDCIEAQDWSLELSRYKPLEQPKPIGDQSVLQLIDELEFIERDVLERLRELRTLIGEAR
jgi:type I restriction enzyme M protein